MKIKALLFFAGLVLGTAPFAQVNVLRVKVDARDEDLGVRLEGATLTVSENGKIRETLTSDVRGKFEVFDLPLQHVYWIELSKPGFVSKCTEINVLHSYPEDLPPVIYQQMEISLFRECKGVDWAYLRKEAMARFQIDKDGYMDYDKGYTKAMLREIEALKLQCTEAFVFDSRIEMEELGKITEDEHAPVRPEPQLSTEIKRQLDWEQERLLRVLNLLKHVSPE